MNGNKQLQATIKMIIEEKPLDMILTYISELIQTRVFLTDKELRLIGLSQNLFTDMDGRETNINKGIMLFNAITVDEIQKKVVEYSKIPILNHCRFNHEDVHFRIFPMKQGEDIIAYFCVMLGVIEDKYDSLLTQLGNILKIEVSKYNLELKNAITRRSDFVTHALLGNITDEQELITLCNINGFDYWVNRLCIFIRKARLQESDKALQRRLDVNINSVINELCKKDDLNIYKLNYNNNIILFLMYSKDIPIRKINRFGYEFATRLNNELSKTVNVSCGVGKCYKGINTLGKSFKQAIKAINLGSKLFDGQKVHSYDQNSVYHILYNGMSYMQLNELYMDTIGLLEEADQENNGELTITLKKYMECNFKATETAKSLHLHRNTLAYRIDKIKDILEYDFDDHIINMKIQMGIYAKYLIDIYDSI